MNRLLVTIIIIFTLTSVYAQPQGRQLERIHAAKMAYITDRLRLTIEQSSGFIPVYREYEKEIKGTRKLFLEKYRDVNIQESDDTTSRQFIDDNLDYQQKVIEIKRKYNDRFLKVITPQQLSDLNKAEREFKKILMHQMEERHNNFGRRGSWNEK